MHLTTCNWPNCSMPLTCAAPPKNNTAADWERRIQHYIHAQVARSHSFKHTQQAYLVATHGQGPLETLVNWEGNQIRFPVHFQAGLCTKQSSGKSGEAVTTVAWCSSTQAHIDSQAVTLGNVRSVVQEILLK